MKKSIAFLNEFNETGLHGTPLHVVLTISSNKTKKMERDDTSRLLGHRRKWTIQTKLDDFQILSSNLNFVRPSLPSMSSSLSTSELRIGSGLVAFTRHFVFSFL